MVGVVQGELLMPTDEALRDYYSELDDARLVQLATELSTLTPIARTILIAELSRRGLDNGEINKYQAEPSMWELQSAGLPIAHQVNGCGTTLLGRWDERPGGSYMTGKWITIFFIPVWRVTTMRVRQIHSPNGSVGYEVWRQEK